MWSTKMQAAAVYLQNETSPPVSVLAGKLIFNAFICILVN